jgi:LacI family transcriptional regulator
MVRGQADDTSRAGPLMRKPSNVTQAQIARKLNLSTVTVSKALRNHSDISPETVQRVKKLALAMGYTPDLIARALSSRRSSIIGVVVPEIDHTFFSTVMKGIFSVAQEKHFQIVLTVSQEDDRREIDNLQTLLSMRVDGILISISEKTKDAEIFELIKRKRVPMVFFDRCLPDPYFSRVVVDDRRGAARAMDYVISQGYRRIAHLSGPPNISIAKERRAGYLDALRSNGIPVRDEWIISCGFAQEDGYRGFRRLLDTGDPPEAVFTANDPLAIGVYDAAKEIGMRIPQDIGVIGFSDNIISRYLSPSLTTVRQPAVEIGETAVNLLLDEIQRPDQRRARQIEIPTQLMIRESCMTGRGKSNAFEGNAMNPQPQQTPIMEREL